MSKTAKTITIQDLVAQKDTATRAMQTLSDTSARFKMFNKSETDYLKELILRDMENIDYNIALEEAYGTKLRKEQ